MAVLVRAIRSFDDLDVMPLSDARVASLLSTLSPDERMASVHILHVDGRVDSAGMAVIELASRLPVVGGVGCIGRRNRPTQWLAEAAYQGVSRHRRHLAALVKDVPPIVRWRDDRDERLD